MKPLLRSIAAGAFLLGGCAGADRLQPGPGAAHIGAPALPVDPPVLDEAPSLSGKAPVRETVRLPDRITLPAAYRLMLVDGHLNLVREADPQAFESSPASLRIVTGEIARGELGYQPALLPQELAAEVAANRESSSRMEIALESVMRRSRELSEQALELEAQGRKLAEMLSAAQARLRELEAEKRDGPPRAPAAAGDVKSLEN